MNVYLHAFKFREPYQVLVDAEMVSTCVGASFELHKGLERTVQGEVKPMITQCCIRSLYDAKNEEAIALAKTFERRRCNHSQKDPKKPLDCIADITNIGGANKFRYVVATMDQELRKELRRVPGVPLLFMNRSVMVMEPMSKATANFTSQVEAKKLTGGLNDAKLGKKIAKPKSPVTEESNGGNNPPLTVSKKKRKGPAGPNPLSVKKKKTESKPEPEKPSSSSNSRRKRSHGKAKSEPKDDQ